MKMLIMRVRQKGAVTYQPTNGVLPFGNKALVLFCTRWP